MGNQSSSLQIRMNAPIVMATRYDYNSATNKKNNNIIKCRGRRNSKESNISREGEGKPKMLILLQWIYVGGCGRITVWQNVSTYVSSSNRFKKCEQFQSVARWLTRNFIQYLYVNNVGNQQEHRSYTYTTIQCCRRRIIFCKIQTLWRVAKIYIVL